MGNNNNEESIYKKLNNLVNEENLGKVDEEDKQVLSVISLIDKIYDKRDVLKLQQKIKDANLQYSKLTEKQKALITNKDKLLFMLEKLNKSLNRVNKVVNLVNNIKIDETNIDSSYINQKKIEIKKVDSVLTRLSRNQQNEFYNVTIDNSIFHIYFSNTLILFS